RLNTTVPLAKWKDGDFSGLKYSNGRPITLYDPLTTQPDGKGGYTREAFPGNRIPQGRFDPVARNALSYWPEPNRPSINPYAEVSNFFETATNVVDSSNLTVRVDHNITSAWRTYGRFNRAPITSQPIDWFGNQSKWAEGVDMPRYSAVWDNTITLGTRSILNFRYGFSRFRRDRVAAEQGFDPTALGFPAYLAAQGAQDLRVARQFTTISPGGVVALGGGGSARWIPNTHVVNASLTHVLSKHTLKAGVEFRKFLHNHYRNGDGFANGKFSFGSQWTQRDPARGNVTEGFGFASFLLGLGSGSQGNGLAVAMESHYYGTYLQDDYRVTRKLTLNLGLRYELDTPRTERYNRLGYFDLSAPSPIAGQVPQFPNLVGAMNFTDANHRRQTPTDTNNFGPHFGFAYQLDAKTVLRGGYALMYDASPMQVAFHDAGFPGFWATTNMITSLDGRTPLHYLRDPFPDGFRKVLGPLPGPTSDAF
ncbi:MAG: TonB-dependent receptor, partial [Acidobacteria bacterium]|nr:TonB-dependent receptor [Acidobacteriota bacterium]